MPGLHWYRDTSIGKKDQSVKLLTMLGWMIICGKSKLIYQSVRLWLLFSIDAQMSNRTFLADIIIG